ncbi:signal transduction histidine kinase [Brevibacterium pityocampae]
MMVHRDQSSKDPRSPKLGRARPSPIRQNVITQLAKAVLTLRMLFVFPVIASWITSPPRTSEIVVLILIAAGTLLLLRRWEAYVEIAERHPLLTVLDIALSAILLVSAGSGSPYFLYLSATAVLIGIVYTGLSRFLLAVILLLACVLVAVLSATVAAAQGTELLEIRLLSTLGNLILLLALIAIGSTLQRLQTQVDLALRRASTNASEAALGEERSRMARELHDSTVKSLVGIDLLARSIELSPQTAQSKAALISESAQTAITESRAILRNLRSGTVPTLCASLSTLACEYEELYPIRFSLDLHEHPPLPDSTLHGVRKIAQEAISNAARHSGSQDGEVELRVDEDTIVLVVRDHGSGFERGRPSAQGHYGLIGMHERAVEIGASLTIDSTRDAGTTITLQIDADPPLKEAAT